MTYRSLSRARRARPYLLAVFVVVLAIVVYGRLYSVGFPKAAALV